MTLRRTSVPAHAAAEGRGSSETESSSGDAPGEDRTPEHRDERPEDAGANGPAPGPVPLQWEDLEAGSPIERGDLVTIGEDGKLHALPRRHEWPDGRMSVHSQCRVCGVSIAAVIHGEAGACPGKSA